MATSHYHPALLGPKLALVTGGSSGIGLELAKCFASEGYDVVIAARRRNRLEAAADEIRRSGISPEVTIVEADLFTRDGVEKLHREVAATGRRLDVLVNNAGQGVWGDFARETDLEGELNIIQLNAAAVVHLTKLFAKDMVKRNSGKILITASLSSMSPNPNFAVYAASKAFVYSFALALRDELKDTGVSVTALCPGATDTNFFRAAHMENSKTVKEGSMADPADVARAGFNALMAGDDHVVTPWKDKIMATMIKKFMPDRMAAAQSRIE